MISNNPPIFSTEIAQSPQEEAEVSVLPIPYEDDPFSHACVTKRVIEQSNPLDQLGMRAFFPEEMTTRKNMVSITKMAKNWFNKISKV